MEEVSSIGGRLSIGDNDSLTSLTGLENIDEASITNLFIYDNQLLSNCEIASVCAYLASPNGSIEIYDNDTGCNSQGEVEEACGLSIGETHSNNELYVSPNPFTTVTTLSFRLFKPENVRFTVYNVQSQIVYAIEEWRERGAQQVQWNADGLPAGMYFFRLEAGGRIGSGKLVVGGW